MNTESQNKERILIVDDEPANLKLLDKMLRAQGYGELILTQNPREVKEQRSSGVSEASALSGDREGLAGESADEEVDLPRQ